MILDPQLLTEIPECVVIELFSIVRNENPRDVEMVNNTLPDEIVNVLLCDSSQGFSFDPLGEIVNSDDQEFELIHCHWERSHYVEPPLSKWLGSVHWSKLL